MGKIKIFLRSAAATAVVFSLLTSCIKTQAKEIPNVSSEKRIALTFDDGPHEHYTNEILDILAEYGIKATFFIVGVCAEKYPHIIAREIAEGHEIGNHTYSHIHVKGANVEQISGEIDRTERLLYEKSGYSTTLFRPPEGVCNDTVRSVAKEMNYQLVLWSIDTKDWIPSSKERIVDTVLREIGAGDIILMHDYIVRNSNTPDALREIIPALLEKGYTFVTVSELMG